MVETLLTGLIYAVVSVGVLLLLQLLWLAGVLAWEDRATVGLGYYGRSPKGRRRFRVALRLHARLLRPVLHLVARVTGFSFARASFRFQGLAGPKGTCDRESFEGGASYRPDPDDVFVVIQMRSGTTWMQHLLYETLHRGCGDLVGSGRPLHAVSPWLESRKTVPVAAAPRVGTERPSRIIKTHFPVELCPFDEDARYVYVTRHPVSCFASCADFIAANTGPWAPDLEALEKWFCSEHMWWGPWPCHVEGWWCRARDAENVLFLHFEKMKADLGAVVHRLVRFLGLRPLSDDERGSVLWRCSFEYMRRYAEAFEMHPPHLLSVESELFRQGTGDRHQDVPSGVRRRVAAWCAREMSGGSYPLPETYPGLADSAGAASLRGRHA